MLPNAYLYQQIPFKVPLLAQLYRVPITYPLRYHHLLFDVLVLDPASPATLAKLLYLSTFTVTRVTSSLHYEWALPHRLSPSPITRITFRWVRSRFTLAALAGLALYCTCVLDGLT